MDWRRASLRWLSLCGIVVPPVDAAINTLAAVQQPGYSFIHDYVSDLAARGRPDSEILCIFWAMFPLLYGPFPFAVRAGLRGHRFGRVTPVLLGLFAVFLGLCGIFRYSPADPESNFSSSAHVIVSTLASASLFAAPFFLWLATRHDPRWRVFRRFSLLAQAGGAVAALLLGLAFLQWLSWGGFAERSYWGVYYVWMFGLAIKLRRVGQSLPDAPLQPAGGVPGVPHG